MVFYEDATQIYCQAEIAALPAEPFNGRTRIETREKAKPYELESGQPAQEPHGARLGID